MAGRTRRRTQRNLIIIGIALVVFIVLIAATALFVGAPQRLYPPEPPEITAQRTSEQNAWRHYLRAFNLLPPAPQLRRIENGAILEAPPGSIGAMLNIQRHDDDPDLATFFQNLGPSLEAIDAGLAAPFLLQPPVEDLRQMQESDAYLYRIVVILAGYGRWEAERNQSCQTGMGRILDAYKLAQQMSADLQASTTAAIPLQALCIAAHRGNCSGDDLQSAIARLTDAGAPFPNAKSLVEDDWRRFQRQADHFLDDSVGSERVGLVLFGSRRIDKQVNWIVERREQLLELAGLRPADLASRLPELGESPDHLWYFGDPVNRLRRMNSTYYQTLSAYETARLVLALELWKKREGTYPATLDALMPGILEAVPLEPFTGSAYRYTPVEDGYRLDTTAPAPSGGQPMPARVEFHGDVAEAIL